MCPTCTYIDAELESCERVCAELTEQLKANTDNPDEFFWHRLEGRLRDAKEDLELVRNLQMKHRGTHPATRTAH
jgi:hypothetical protein